MPVTKTLLVPIEHRDPLAQFMASYHPHLDHGFATAGPGRRVLFEGEPSATDIAHAFLCGSEHLACFDELLAACKAALELPDICEEIGYAGNHTCLQDGHAIIKTKNGEYVALHTQGGYPARDRILAKLQAAIARAEKQT